jgi:DNA invertase Pin-like site-specific DNA recombinase
MIKATAYLRVSTAEQSLENQRPQVEAYAKAHGYTLVEVYAESESGWRQGHQAELKRLFADLRSGRRRYDVLLVVALDRLTRGGIGIMWQTINTFEVHGCRVVSLKETWTEVSGPFRDLFQAITAWSASYESDRKSQNTRAGQARILKAGVTSKGRKITQLGRPKGAKDKGRRKRTGYLLRYANKDQKRDREPSGTAAERGSEG